MKFLVINGPNLNMLGKREPHIYGNLTLDEIKNHTEKALSNYKVTIDWFQSNIEGEIVVKIQEASQGNYDALIINPAAYSHTSVAIHDALKLVPFDVIEVHLSNTHSREEFRNVKITAKAATAVMEGLGKDAYQIAIYSQLIKQKS